MRWLAKQHCSSVRTHRRIDKTYYELLQGEQKKTDILWNANQPRISLRKFNAGIQKIEREQSFSA